MKKVCVITATRAEYGLLYPLLLKIEGDPELELLLVVSGTHLSEEHGYTKNEILRDGFRISREIPILGEKGSGYSVSEYMGNAIIKFDKYLEEIHPDIAVILGDRYEMMAFAVALVNRRIPIAHLNGGEVTLGALDEIYRHCITKMSTLHFTNCEVHRKRVIQMGESPDRVFDVGDICVDNVRNEPRISIEELEDSLKVELEKRRIVVVTYHPVTMEAASLTQIHNLLEAVQNFKELFFVFTKANADEGGREINACLQDYVEHHDNAILVDSLGRRRYLSLLSFAVMVLGNSSSGIYEAPLFRIPTVNIGSRQKGRLHGNTVIDCGISTEEIIDAMETALGEPFNQKCMTCKNLFGDGHTAEQIMEILKSFLKGNSNPEKNFYDIQY